MALSWSLEDLEPPIGRQCDATFGLISLLYTSHTVMQRVIMQIHVPCVQIAGLEHKTAPYKSCVSLKQSLGQVAFC